MVKRRRVNNSPVHKKKRSENSSAIPANQEKSILNEGLLNLYKKDLMDKDNVPKDLGDLSSEKQLQSENMQNLKTPAKDKKRKSTAPVAKYSNTKYEDVGGMREALLKVLESFLHHVLPEKLQKRKPIRGILLHGPPGCGKTLLVSAVAGELELPMVKVAATDLVQGISGESEGKIREAFEAAIATGRCILFIDNIEAICLKGSDNAMNLRMSRCLRNCFDDLIEKDKEGRVMVVAATNQPDTLDHTLRGGGRFECEVPIGMPDKIARLEILEVLCKGMKLSPDVSLQRLAKSTPGYVGGDLLNLVNLAERFGHRRVYELPQSSLEPGVKDSQPEKMSPSTVLFGHPSQRGKLSSSEFFKEVRKWWNIMKDIPEEVQNNFVFTDDDFKNALKECVPYAQKEGFAPVDSVTWDDVGALEDIKEDLQQNIVWPIKYSDWFENYDLSTPKGILLFGPKGCGKTLVAKAIANECNLNFLSVNGPELLSMYVGESERAIRNTFERAQNSAPCVIFFDEFDALCPPRSSTKENAPVERVVNQLLCMSDGTRSLKQVFIVAATNRLDKIDSAMLRPGRLETVYYVGLPSADGRADILRSLTKKKTRTPIHDDVLFKTIAQDPRCEGFSGADMAHLIRKATSIAVKEIVSQVTEDDDLSNKKFILKNCHFNKAMDFVKPSISEQDRRYFQKYGPLCHARTAPPNTNEERRKE